MSSSDGVVRIIKKTDDSLEEIDSFDIFRDPHGLNDQEPEPGLSPYANMFHRTQAKFSTWDKDVYLCMAESLQYVYVVNAAEKQLAKRICLTLFPTTLEMNYGSEGLWAVGTRIGTIVFKHIEDESPQRYNGSQNVTAISFTSDGK